MYQGMSSERKLHAYIIILPYQDIWDAGRHWRNYWWPGISKYVLNYVDGCDVCQRGKTFPEMPAGKLMLNPIPNMPWMDISVDFVTGLPEAQGYIIPTIKETNSLGLAHLY